jgi:hypothetical protein
MAAPLTPDISRTSKDILAPRTRNPIYSNTPRFIVLLTAGRFFHWSNSNGY